LSSVSFYDASEWALSSSVKRFGEHSCSSLPLNGVWARLSPREGFCYFQRFGWPILTPQRGYYLITKICPWLLFEGSLVTFEGKSLPKRFLHGWNAAHWIIMIWEATGKCVIAYVVSTILLNIIFRIFIRLRSG